MTPTQIPDPPAPAGGEPPEAGRPLLFAAMLMGIAAMGLGLAGAFLTGSAIDVATALAAAAGLGLLAAGWRQAARSEQTTAALQARMLAAAQADPLTGLMDRLAFQRTLEAIDASAQGMTIILFFDLDRFKEVNDTLGHKVGDELLLQVAERAVRALPATAKIARLGGDEFAAIVPWDFAQLPERYGLAIVEAMRRPFTIADRQIAIGGSVGVAVGDAALIAGGELLRRADIAMYAAKAGGGGRVRCFDADLDQRQTRETSVRHAVGAAITADGFRLHFQPLIEARTGKLDSVEALIRSQAPGLRDVPAASLIATAEASGQIHTLTDWTIAEALRAACALDGVPVAVNISPVVFRQSDFVERVRGRLADAQVPAERLVIEITEAVLIENAQAAQASLSALRAMGVRVHLDDFGTGYSSLSHIRDLDLDGLKLDRSLLREIGSRRRTHRMVRAMIDFGHSLDLRVMVEGVESEWQLRLLQQLGADVLQGYEIAMPMPLDELIAFKQSLDTERRPARGGDQRGAGRPAERAGRLRA